MRERETPDSANTGVCSLAKLTLDGGNVNDLITRFIRFEIRFSADRAFAEVIDPMNGNQTVVRLPVRYKLDGTMDERDTALFTLAPLTKTVQQMEYILNLREEPAVWRKGE